MRLIKMIKIMTVEAIQMVRGEMARNDNEGGDVSLIIMDDYTSLVIKL